MRTKIILHLFFIQVLSVLPAQAAELFFERDPSLPLVYITAAFHGGATQDPDQRSGTTDLMGRLMLRGTKNKTKSQIDLALDQMGGAIEFETRAEFIAFRGMVLSENLQAYLSLLAEIITSPSFRGKELERLKREQVSQLLDELNQDRSLVRLRFDETFFRGHPYSKPNHGKIKDIQSLGVTDLQKQYQKLITGSNMILLASGDADRSGFEDFLGTISKDRPGSRTLSSIPEFKSPPSKLRVVIFDKPERTQTQVLLGQKGVSFKTPDLDALQIANHAFGGGGFQARLMIELRVKRGWTYGAGSSFKLGSSPHSWKIGFFPKNADTPAAIKEALKMVGDLKQNGITEAEFESAKKSIVNSAGFTFNTPQKRLENRLTEVIFGLPEGYFTGYAERISRISREQVNSALSRFIEPDHMMVGLVATASISRSAVAKELGIPESQVEIQSYQRE
ncbi:MAG: insulinase family protein [Bdellovibrionales bacterium]|nr:insulinase family protein [Bdellovibrionales bacterium]